jgi:hypothetical protein
MSIMKCLLNDTCIDRNLITLYSACVGFSSDYCCGVCTVLKGDLPKTKR